MKRELLANYAGRAWTALANFLCVPFYVHWLGPESYGVVAFAATLQSAATLLDFGFSTAVAREVARSRAAGASDDYVRDLVRTIETIYWLIGLAICAAIVALAGPISAKWLVATSLSPKLIRASLMVAAAGLAFTWPVTFYMGLMMGLNKQVQFNAINTAGLTVRFGCTAIVCWLAPHDLVAFFTAQAVTACLSVAALFVAAWHFVPGSSRRPAFRCSVLFKARTFLTGMTLANTAILIFTQLDKAVLSKLLTLEQFGYYSLAWTAAGVLYTFYSPVSTLFLPKFSATLVGNDTATATSLYHLSCQLVAVGAAPTAVLLALFPYEMLHVWTRSAAVVAGTAPLLRILIPFSLVGCLGVMPAVFQWAAGWTSLTSRTNFVAIVLLVPLMYAGFLRAGAIGAILGWGVVRLAQSIAQVELMHRKMLIGEKLVWYRDAVLRPVGAAAAVGLCWRLLAPARTHFDLLLVCAVWVTSAGAGFMCSPLAGRVAPLIAKALPGNLITVRHP